MSTATPSARKHDPAAPPTPHGVAAPTLATAPTVQELVAAPKQRHPLVVLAAIVVVVIIAAAGTSFLVRSGGRQSTNDAYVEGRIIRISPKVSGQVISLRVDDNDSVKAGDLLLEIDPVDYQAKVDQAIAAGAAAESAGEQGEGGGVGAEGKGGGA